MLLSEIYNAMGISIHALREEGDRCGLDDGQGDRISIHALREEGDRRRWLRAVR